MFFILCILFFVSTILADSFTTEGGIVTCGKKEYLKGFCAGGDGSTCPNNAVTDIQCKEGHESWFSNLEYQYGNLGTEDFKILECPRRKIITSICTHNCELNGETYDYIIGCKKVVDGVQWNTKKCTQNIPHVDSDYKSATCSEIPLKVCFSKNGGNHCNGNSYYLECCTEEYEKDLDGVYALLGILPPLFIAITLGFCCLNRHFANIKRAERKAADDAYVPTKKRKQNVTTSQVNLWSATSMADMEKAIQLEMEMLASGGPDTKRMGSRI